MNDFMEELRNLAQDYKEKQQEFIERITKKDLAYITSIGNKVSALEVQRLRSNLDYISDRYQEMRIINHFVDFCDATRPDGQSMGETE